MDKINITIALSTSSGKTFDVTLTIPKSAVEEAVAPIENDEGVSVASLIGDIFDAEVVSVKVS